MTENNRVEYLWQAACTLPPTNQTNKLLKSYYLTISRKVAKIRHCLPKLKYGDAGMCRKCSTSWFDGNFTMQTIPKQISSLKATRLINAFETGKELTRKQKIRAKWYKKRVNSYVQLHCKLCQNKTLIPLKKTIHESKESTSKIKEEIPVSIEKKKKKKKDKSAGLLLPTSELNTIIKKQTKEIKSQQSQSVSKSIEKISHQTGKSKKSQKNSKIKPAVVSRTQQKNSMLDLAKMLKKSSTMDRNNSSNNRLQNLLK